MFQTPLTILSQLSLPSSLPGQELESCQQHGQALRCGAAALLAAVPPPELLSLPEGGERLPQLYDARALQLWLLKCCQAVSLMRLVWLVHQTRQGVQWPGCALT